MGKPLYHLSHLLIILTIFLTINYSVQLEPSQSQSLSTVQQLLNYPSVLSSWDHTTDFCNSESHPSVTVVCYQNNITQLEISGENGGNPLPQNFSTDALFTALANFSSLRVLSLDSLGLWGPLPGSIGGLSSLEILSLSSNFLNGTIPMQISLLRNLQTLRLDQNMLTGQVPPGISSLPLLAVLSLKNNSLSGSLPNSLSNLGTLRALELSRNHLSGEVPNFQNLTYLQVLDLEGNYFGPHFPNLHPKLMKLVLRENRFSFGIPSELGSFYHLEKMDISSNGFTGPFVPSLLSLPSISYLDVSANRFTGILLQNSSCNDKLVYVNLSSNLLTGHLPTCLKWVAVSFGNCLSNGEKEQRPKSYCEGGPMAVAVPHEQKEKGPFVKVVLASIIVGGGILGAVLFCLVFLVIKKGHSKSAQKAPITRCISENASSMDTLKQLSDARHICQTMKLGALGLPAYRAFTLEELKEATNNFDASNVMAEGSHGQIYKGTLADGAAVAIRSLEMRKRHSSQSYTHDIELISKLRHPHLVSVLGHCLDCHEDDLYVRRIYLLFESVSNETLRGLTSEAPRGQRLTWMQRLAAVIGVTKGIQFLHTGVIPGVFSNNTKITDVLVDHNLHVKIGTYKLLLLAETKQKVCAGAASFQQKGSFWERCDSMSKSRTSFPPEMDEDKNDIYDLGVILLEIIVGRPITSRNDIHVAKDLLLVSLRADKIARRGVVDPEVQKECSDNSLKTMMEICTKCLSTEPTDRPSLEDVLWNLQFAAQSQVSWRSGGSPSP